MSGDAADFLEWMLEAGFRVGNKAGRVVVAPSSRITPQLADEIRRHKAGLLAILEGPDWFPPDDSLVDAPWEYQAFILWGIKHYPTKE